MTDRARILTARRLLAGTDRSHAGGGLLVRGGRVERLLASPGAVRRAASAAGVKPLDLGDSVLAPGLVNAHAHLELSGLAGRLPRGGDFLAWVRGMIAATTKLTSRARRRAIADGARRALAGGTTTVGDVTTLASGGAPGPGAWPRRVAYREVLDGGDARRTTSALDRVARALPRRRSTLEGLSPHAPHTVSEGLLERVAALARRRSLPITVHWSESREECEWLATGGGPFAELLGPGPGRRGLDALERAGLLGPRLSLVHGNHPARGEPARIAACGATVVHCPGTHAYFEREPFPWRRWRRAGVPIALGTDSLASNDDLDLRREMARLRAAAPGVAPREVWAMGTEVAARAVGMEGEVGELRPGAWADLVAFRVDAGESDDELLDALTADEGSVAAVFVAGRRASLPATGSAGRTARPRGSRTAPSGRSSNHGLI
jgi:cytosine/adenosine deaminase-related metal-dependent hydrolase